jgi:hypothetical protein
MAIRRPLRRTCRQFADGSYSKGDHWKYILHPKFAQSPAQYIRAFLLLQEDLQRLFQYVEPSDINLPTYSFRIQELLLRTCVEVEANCKAILAENGYSKPGHWDMSDYKKIEDSHFVSAYTIKYPAWQGSSDLRQPFSAWSTGGSLLWYSAYNTTKHDRHITFHQATFQHLTDAMGGLVVLLSAQFWTHEFAPTDWLLTFGGPQDGMDTAIGGYFRVRFPSTWPQEKRYDFNWQQLESESDPFDEYPHG